MKREVSLKGSQCVAAALGEISSILVRIRWVAEIAVLYLKQLTEHG